MWPITLDLTRDECRGILRRSELESYSSVMSTFRAQGTLTETKLKILQDLRDIFHISQDRHKAEARRVVNDERLCTVAELIAGPNTGSEWSKEGHRSCALLPRSAAHTGLLVTADNAASVAVRKNHLLPLPSDTVRDYQPESLPISNKPIVTADPLEAIQNANSIKQLLKRPHSLSESSNSAGQKKRITETPQINHTNIKIQQLYHTHSKTGPVLGNAQQQQQLHQPYQRKTQTKRSMPAKGARGAAAQKPLKIKNSAVTSMKTPSNRKNAKMTPAYANSAKSNKMVNINKALVAETFPDKPEIWPNDYIVANNEAMSHHQPQQYQLQLGQQQHQPPPVQIIYTSPIDANLSLDQSSNLIDINKTAPLITESTPISWLPKPATLPESTNPTTNRTIKMILPQTTTPTSSSMNPSSKKFIQKTVAQSSSHSVQHGKQVIKNARRKININAISNSIEPQQHIDLTSSSSSYQSNVDHKQNYIIPESMQIQSMTTTTTNVINMPIQTNIVQPQKPLQIITSTTNKSNMIAPTTPTSSATKPKIQITSHTIISPGKSTLKLTSQQPLQLKQFQSKGNVKLIQGTDGRMIIKGTGDNTMLSGIKHISGNASTILSSPIVSSAASPGNKMPLQKVQLIPSNKLGGKTNMVVMQKLSGSPHLSNFTTILPKDKLVTLSGKNPSPKYQIMKNHNNVVVLDMATDNTTNNASTGLIQPDSGNKNVITEDTPVDIISSDVRGSSNQINDTKLKLKPKTQTQKIVTKKIIKLPMPSKNNELVETINVDEHVITTTPTTSESVVINTTDWENELDQAGSNNNKILKTAKDNAGSVSNAESEERKLEGDAHDMTDENDYIEEDAFNSFICNELSVGDDDDDDDNDDIIQYEEEEITSTETDTTRKNRILYSSNNISSTTTTLTTGTAHHSNNKTFVVSQEVAIAADVTQSYSSTPHKNNNNNNNVNNKLQNLPVEPTVNLQQTDNCNVGDFVGDSNENVMLQMQEFDQSGSSQLRNVSVEELVASGHIILDEPNE